jgi:diacylglycerol kinase
MKPVDQDSGIKKFKIIERLKSFRNAFSGIATLVKHEHNARIHLVILIVVVFLGISLKISAFDWIAVVFASGLVFISESFNTALECLSDAVSSEYNEKIRRAKDLAAGGVLISAIVSVIIGLIVFLPGIYRFLFP